MIIRSVLYSGLVAAGLFGASLPSDAAASKWFTMPGSKMRLVTAAMPDSLQFRAALEIRLDKGWKTYWRSPGESGIPPQFSFLGSSNVASIKVGFPTPSSFNDYGTRSVGYKRKVVFPISVTAIELRKPTVLKLGAVLGICGEVCIPVQTQLSVRDPGTRSPTFEVTRLIEDAAMSVPVAPSQDFRVVNASWMQQKPGELVIESIVPKDTEKASLHIEGPADWYLLPATLTRLEDGKAQFVLNISDIPEDAKPTETELRFTLVADGRGVEQLLTPKM